MHVLKNVNYLHVISFRNSHIYTAKIRVSGDRCHTICSGIQIIQICETIRRYWPVTRQITHCHTNMQDRHYLDQTSRPWGMAISKFDMKTQDQSHGWVKPEGYIMVPSTHGFLISLGPCRSDRSFPKMQRRAVWPWRYRSKWNVITRTTPSYSIEQQTDRRTGCCGAIMRGVGVPLNVSPYSSIASNTVLIHISETSNVMFLGRCFPLHSSLTSMC